VKIRAWPAAALLTLVAAALLIVLRSADGTDAVVPTPTVAPLPAGADGLALPKTPGSLRFAVMGDVGRGDAHQYDTASEMARWHERVGFEFVLMLGDNNYGAHTPADYALRFERPYKALLDRGVRFQAVLGNHDPVEQPDYAPYNMNGHRYYSFQRPAGLLPRQQVQFFAIDSVTLDQQQLEWLQRELQASTADWKIAFFHHPLYTSGRYRLQTTRLRRILEPLFVRHGVDVTFSGHEHFYERLIPLQGAQHFVSGAGGALRVGDLRDSSITAAGFDEDMHFVLVEISGDTLFFQAISRTGRTVDSGRLERADDPALPPSLRK
jgi:hypothetical protein